MSNMQKNLFLLLISIAFSLSSQGILQGETAFAAPIMDQAYQPTASNVVFSPIGGRSRADQYNEALWAQTFTVSTSGTLTGIDLLLQSSASATYMLYMDIRSTVGGLPSAGNLRSPGNDVLAYTYAAPASSGYGGAIPANAYNISSGSYDYFRFDLTRYTYIPDPDTLQPYNDTWLTGGLRVTAGDTLAIVLRTDDGYSPAYAWGGTRTDGYSGGSAYSALFAYDYENVQWGTDLHTADLAFRTYIEPDATPGPGPAPVPEPSTMVLLGAGLAGLVGYGRRRLKR